MGSFYIIYYMVKADFLERVRRYSFLVTIVITIIVGYSLVPSIDEPYGSFVIYGCRGIYNSAWIGTTFGVVCATMLTLIGFYLVKNSVNRDYQTRVGQIIATTPLSKPLYMIGKWLSNLAVLVNILVVLTIMALIMQLVRAEDTSVNLWELAAPIWLMGLPVLSIVSAVAVFFESVSFLKGGLGHIIFISLWAWLLVSGSIFLEDGNPQPGNDYAGLSRTFYDIKKQLNSEGFNAENGDTDLYVPNKPNKKITRIDWKGVSWSFKNILDRLLWFGVGLLIALSASIPFDRFDPAKYRIKSRKKKKGSGKRPLYKRILVRKLKTDDIINNTISAVPLTSSVVKLTALRDRKSHYRFSAVVVSELRLMLKGKNFWWYAVALGLMIANIVTPFDVARKFLFPASMLWPIFIWSSMGNNEKRNRTETLFYSTSNYIYRQLPAMWLAGFIIALGMSLTFVVKLLILGLAYKLIGWLAGLIFIPSLAFALGVWTNSNRFFELVYFLWWYLGILIGIKIFDFTGMHSDVVSVDNLLYYLAFSIILIVLTILGRKKQLHN